MLRPGTRTAIAATLCLALAAPALAAGYLDLAPIRVGDHEFHRRVLDNGLRAVAVQDEGDDVTVFMIVGAGKRQETPSTTGLAHLAEHAMYTGTARTGPGEHDRVIKGMGGKSNAFTREDYTLYYDHGVAADRLWEVLSMEADRLTGLTFDEEAFRKERASLVKEEKSTYRSDLARDELVDSVVYRVHPYRAGVMDEAGHTRAGNLDLWQVKRFYRLHYRPDNTAVVVAGGIEPGEALAAIQAAFGNLPRMEAPPALAREPEADRGDRHTFESDLSQDRVVQAWVVPAVPDPDLPSLDVLARLLSRRNLADGSPVVAELGERVDQNLFRLSASGPDAEAGLEALLEEVRRGPLEADEVEKVKALLRDDFTSWSLRERPYFALAAFFGVYEVLGHPEYPARYGEWIDAVTPTGLVQVARRYLSPARRTAVVFTGSGETPPPLPDGAAALAKAAQDATDAGDLERAVAAYTKLLDSKPNKMYTVIYLASRGQVLQQMREYDRAIADYEQALQVVDYPAVRDLLQEARGLKYGIETGGAAPVRMASSSPAPAMPPSHATGAMPPEGHMPEPAPHAGASSTQPVHHPMDDLDVQGTVVEDRSLGRAEVERILSGHAVTADRAGYLSRLILMDRYRVTYIGAGRSMIWWDLRFEDKKTTKEFMTDARWPLQREGWEVKQKGADIRLKRVGGEMAPPPARKVTWTPEREEESKPEPEEKAMPRRRDSLLNQSVQGNVIEEFSLGRGEMIGMLRRHPVTAPQAEELAGLIREDLYRRTDIGAGRTMEFWDLRFVDKKDVRVFMDAARWPLQREGWEVDQRGRDIRLRRYGD